MNNQVGITADGRSEMSVRRGGQRTIKNYRLGQRIRVLVDRIDPVEKKIQFAIVEEQDQHAAKRKRR